MPRLSAFPKCYMDDLCVTRSMTLFDWIDLAATLGVDGVEMYPGFFASFEPEYVAEVKRHAEAKGLEIPMILRSAARRRALKRSRKRNSGSI
jgi:sugar phosphate isomerase/epimerase